MQHKIDTKINKKKQLQKVYWYGKISFLTKI